jgi:glyoxylase-like metal-dependent hydrolase (beta-lactamase superfamily II)
MNIVNVGYDSTNYYVLADKSPRLLVDVGWPGTFPKLQHQCTRLGIALSAVHHLLITHYHPDHAGLAQELKRIGCQLILLENQRAAVPALKMSMKPDHPYVEIDLTDNLVLSLADSRAFLARLGIQGEILSTPGHSDDSVTLILDEGIAFTGDLPHPVLLSDESNKPLQASWAKIRALHVHTVYPGHGPIYHLDR